MSDTWNQGPAPRDIPSSGGLASPTLLISTLALALWSASCAPRARVASPAHAPEEVGVASWYGRPHHGRVAASGDVFDMEQLTAAHRTLPFGTRVRVHNLTNGRTVAVRINDRGPFLKNRIIDLSRAAARSLGMLGPGTAPVRLEVLSGTAPITDGAFAVQVGAFRVRPNAERLHSLIARSFEPVVMTQKKGDPPLWRVLVGYTRDAGEAAALARHVRAAVGESAADAFVVRLD